MSKRKTKHCRKDLPRLDGTKAAKKRYNAAYWEKVGSKKPQKRRRGKRR